MLDAQVIGVPSERYGEEVMAWVRARPESALTGDALKAFCKGRIANYKIPAHWRFVDAFPMTVTGKVQKFRMRDKKELERYLDGYERDENSPPSMRGNGKSEPRRTQGTRRKSEKAVKTRSTTSRAAARAR